MEHEQETSGHEKQSAQMKYFKQYGEISYTVYQVEEIFERLGYNWNNAQGIKKFAEERGLLVDLSKLGIKGFDSTKYVINKSDLPKIIVGLDMLVTSSDLEDTIRGIGLRN